MKSEPIVRSLFSVTYNPGDKIFVTEARGIILPGGDISETLAKLDEQHGEGRWEVMELEVKIYSKNPDSADTEVCANLLTDGLLRTVGWTCTWVRDWNGLYTRRKTSALMKFRGRLHEKPIR